MDWGFIKVNVKYGKLWRRSVRKTLLEPKIPKLSEKRKAYIRKKKQICITLYSNPEISYEVNFSFDVKYSLLRFNKVLYISR